MGPERPTTCLCCADSGFSSGILARGVVFEGFEEFFDFVNFRQNLGNGAASAGGGVGPELLQSFGQLLFSHCGPRVARGWTNPHPALRADLSRRERYVHQNLYVAI